MFKRNKLLIIYILIAPLLYFLCAFIYKAFGHRIIELIYLEKAGEFFNGWITNRTSSSLQVYQRLGDAFFAKFQIGLKNYLIVAFPPILYVLDHRKRVRNILFEEIDDFKSLEKKTSKAHNLKNNIIKAGFYLLLFSVFYSFCSFVANQFLVMNEYFYGNTFFNADHLEDTVKQNNVKHPLIFLIEAPIFHFFRLFLHSDISAMIAVNTFMGVVAVLLIYKCYYIIHRKQLEALLITIFFGLSMSTMIFNSIPETYSFALVTIVLSYILFLNNINSGKINFILWTLAGLFAAGVTITNFVLPLIAFSLLVGRFKPKGERISLVLIYIAFVFSILVILNSILHWFVPEANSFSRIVDIKIRKYLYNISFYKIVLELVKNFFLFNFIALFPNFPVPFKWPNLVGGFSYFGAPINYTIYGIIAGILWIIVIAVRVIYGNIDEKYRIFYLGVVLHILFNVSLHSFYNLRELFLYSMHYTFPICLLIFAPVRFNRIIYLGLLALLMLFMCINNTMVIKWMYSCRLTY